VETSQIQAGLPLTLEDTTKVSRLACLSVILDSGYAILRLVPLSQVNKDPRQIYSPSRYSTLDNLVLPSKGRRETFLRHCSNFQPFLCVPPCFYLAFWRHFSLSRSWAAVVAKSQLFWDTVVLSAISPAVSGCGLSC
jgi:hypothetical protein